MKTFRRAAGGEVQTMTVGELRKELAEYPDDMPVFSTWEGVMAHIEPDSFFTQEVSKGNEEDACNCLIIDVECY